MSRLEFGHRIVALAALVLFQLSYGSTAADAAESRDGCSGFITSLPVKIDTEGTWCLKQNLTTTLVDGFVIEIVVDNVAIDCNGFAIDGVATAATKAYGIVALGRRNVAIRRCIVRGFFNGITLTGSGHVVEDNLFNHNTDSGMSVGGDGSVVRRNRVLNTGGTAGTSDVYGIHTNGSGGSVDILDNTVSGVFARSGSNGSAMGIVVNIDSNGSVRGNRIRGLHKDGTGFSYGIFNLSTGRVVVRNNEITGDASLDSSGVYCLGGAKGRAKNNVINGFASAIVTCGDAGGNDISP